MTESARLDIASSGAPAPLSADRPATRLATRLAFFVGGFGIACWAPLVPYAKQRLGVDDGTLGLLLLCLGLGSVPAMVLTGSYGARHGSRWFIRGGGFGLALCLPLLVLAGTPLQLGLALALFGALLGSLDVAMNIHAVEVERAAKRPLMSGFHAQFSLGGLVGSALMTFLLSLSLGTVASSLACAALMVFAMAVAAPRLLRAAAPGDGPLFALPRGIVLLLAALAAVTFLVEGAILDWGALLLTDARLLATEQGGLGYVLFSVAMTIGRLGGDAITARLGDRLTLLYGGIAAVAGFGVVLAAPVAAVALAGFFLIGLGASNLVPVLFRRAGTQRAMPAGLAVAAITTTGYAGVLAGPALVGLVSNAVGLPVAFGLLGLLMALVPLCAARVAASDR